MYSFHLASLRIQQIRFTKEVKASLEHANVAVTNEILVKLLKRANSETVMDEAQCSPECTDTTHKGIEKWQPRFSEKPQDVLKVGDRQQQTVQK